MQQNSGGTGSTNRNGTCYTNEECITKGGTAAGLLSRLF